MSIEEAEEYIDGSVTDDRVPFYPDVIKKLFDIDITAVGFEPTEIRSLEEFKTKVGNNVATVTYTQKDFWGNTNDLAKKHTVSYSNGLWIDSYEYKMGSSFTDVRGLDTLTFDQYTKIWIFK